MAGKKPKPIASRSDFAALLADVKGHIQSAQTRAVMAVNSELVRLYWDIGRIIDDRQQREGWGAGVIPRLAVELKNELPDLKGFSEQNIGRMIAFYREYPDPIAIVPQPAAQYAAFEKVPQLVAQLTAKPILPRPVAKPIEKVQPPVARLRAAMCWSVRGHITSSASIAGSNRRSASTTGLIPRETLDRLLAECSFAGMDKPIGIPTDELTRALPRGLHSVLTTVNEIEAELSGRPRRAVKRRGRNAR